MPDAKDQRNRWSIEIPHVLSLITTHSLTGRVAGLREFPVEDQPPMLIPFYSFRAVIVAGVALCALMVWSVWRWRGGAFKVDRIAKERGLLRARIVAIPVAYLAVEMGWLTREVGRQPWIIYGIMRTEQAASALPGGAVAATLVTYAVIDLLPFVVFLVCAARLIRHGPDLEIPLPAAWRLSSTNMLGANGPGVSPSAWAAWSRRPVRD